MVSAPSRDRIGSTRQDGRLPQTHSGTTSRLPCRAAGAEPASDTAWSKGRAGIARHHHFAQYDLGIHPQRGLAFQKKTLFALEQVRADVARRSERWKTLQRYLDPERLVFIDETWIKTNMTPIRGWGPKGRRLRAFTPQGHWRTLTFLGALRNDRLTAPCVFDRPINGQCFRAYVEQQLTPVLRPGDIVIMDNLGSHKSAAIRQAIKAAGARLWFLPPYSPDLNPIEQAFSKIKHWMRHAQKRTIDDTWRHIGTLVETIQPHECANYLTNAGYASVKT